MPRPLRGQINGGEIMKVLTSASRAALTNRPLSQTNRRDGP